MGLAAAHGSTLYVADDANDFGTLNLSTGAFTLIGTIKDNANVGRSFSGDGDTVGGLSFGPSGTLYGLTLDSTSTDPMPTGSDLVTINPANAATTDLGNIGESVDTTLALPDGTLLANDVNNDNTYQLTGGPLPTVVRTVNSGAPLGGGLTFGPGGFLYSEAFELPTFAGPGSAGFEDQLYRLDPTTLVGTFVGEIQDASHFHYSVAAAAYDGTTLYGFTDQNKIITIDTSTGAATLIGTVSLPPSGGILDAATFAPRAAVPEPSPLALLAPGLLLGLRPVGLTARRRRQAA